MGLNGSLLAIDAGNSKTDVAVLGRDGSVLGTARGGGFQPPVVGVGAALEGLADIVDRAWAAAGADDGTPPAFSHVSACLANVDLAVEERS